MMLKINTNFKKRIGWSLAILVIFGLFSYLTFIPAQTFAADIVDPDEDRSLSDVDTMQEMSRQICINSPENETKQLRDTRDNKSYWVTKLRDGNCWMTQNLDFDGGGTKMTDITLWAEDASVQNTTAAYFDPGDYIYNVGTDGLNGDCTKTVFADCTTQFTRISSSSLGANLHHHVGNYYTWPAATSGNICPTGWKLPTSNSTTNNGSFGYMISQYGWSDGLSNNSTMNDGRGIYGDPLYFIYVGFLRDGVLYRAGDRTNYWSSTGNCSNASRACTLYIGSLGAVYPSSNDNRRHGMPVRCFAAGGWLDSYPELLDDNQANVSIQVSPIINLDVTKSADDMVVDFNSIDTSTIDINVSSNQKYQVTLTTDQPNLTPHKSDNSEYSIKMVGTSGGVVEKGKNGWGIKKKLSATNDSQLGSLVNEPTYSPIGINNDQITFYRSAGPEALTNQTDPANPLQLEVGVSVDQSLPSDTYSTMVTVTAMAY